MALVLCPECGEETLDRLTNCPLCDEQLIDNQASDESAHKRLILFGAAFVGGLFAATFCNIMGYTTLAMGLAVASLLSLAILLVKLNKTK